MTFIYMSMGYEVISRNSGVKFLIMNYGIANLKTYKLKNSYWYPIKINGLFTKKG